MVEIEHRSKAEIEAGREYLRGHQPAAGPGKLDGIRVVGELAHCRQSDEALPQALDTTAFLIDGNQQVRALGAHGPAEIQHLARMVDVAREQDQAADLRLAQQLAILGSQPGAADIQHQ